jgi:hypothetical protein
MTYTWLGINVGQVLSAFRPNNFSHWPSHLLPQPWLPGTTWPRQVLFLGPVVATLGARAPYCCAAPLEPWQQIFPGEGIRSASASCIDIVDMLVMLVGFQSIFT